MLHTLKHIVVKLRSSFIATCRRFVSPKLRSTRYLELISLPADHAISIVFVFCISTLPEILANLDCSSVVDLDVLSR